VKKFLGWLDRKVDLEAVLIAIGHDMREVAMLWLVFSFLDMLIQNKLTLRWLLSNGLCCILIWTVGAFIEMKHSSERGRQ
jgi:hypothetical protein